MPHVSSARAMRRPVLLRQSLRQIRTFRANFNQPRDLRERRRTKAYYSGQWRGVAGIRVHEGFDFQPSEDFELDESR